MVVGVVDVDAFKRDGFVKIEQAVCPEASARSAVARTRCWC